MENMEPVNITAQNCRKFNFVNEKCGSKESEFGVKPYSTFTLIFDKID